MPEKDYGWHLRHLKRLAKSKRLREAHLLEYGKIAPQTPKVEPKIEKLGWWKWLLEKLRQMWYFRVNGQT